jgi:hypothetical protein
VARLSLKKRREEEEVEVEAGRKYFLGGCRGIVAGRWGCWLFVFAHEPRLGSLPKPSSGTAFLPPNFHFPFEFATPATTNSPS